MPRDAETAHQAGVELSLDHCQRLAQAGVRRPGSKYSQERRQGVSDEIAVLAAEDERAADQPGVGAAQADYT